MSIDSDIESNGTFLEKIHISPTKEISAVQGGEKMEGWLWYVDQVVTLSSGYTIKGLHFVKTYNCSSIQRDYQAKYL